MGGEHYSIKKICISDPAGEHNVYQALEIVKFLKNKYKNSEIYFIFHRKVETSYVYNILWGELEKVGVNLVNITGSYEGFKIYDDCDLHIGYRVHAHIYNLSNRNVSLLLEEDGRGAGANEALGIKGVSVYNQNKYILGIIRRIKYYKLRVFLIYLINKLNLQNTKEILLELDNTLDVMNIKQSFLI